MIKIDKYIPIPAKYKERKYPLPEMDVGDSFYVELADQYKTKKIIASAIHSSVIKLKRTEERFKDFKMLLRSVEGGMRCWRVK